MQQPVAIQRWLTSAAQPYASPERVVADVNAALSSVPTIRPKSDVFTFDDGRTQLLLCIHGLLPIIYRSTTYNIPVAVWITRDYPCEPPLAFVVPTSDMLVRPGRFVDVSGRLSIEYIQLWFRKSESCDIVGLLRSMQDLFSREPPLYSKPVERTPPSSVSALSSPPPRPPRPPSTFFNFTAASSPNRPAVPPSHHPPQIISPSARFVNSPSHGSASSQNILPFRPAVNLLDDDFHGLDPPSAAVPSPPPPLAPNPEQLQLHQQVYRKLISEQSFLFQVLAADADRLRAQQSDLLAGELAIRDEMSRLHAVRDVCRVVSDRLQENIIRAESNISELHRKGDPEVDELVCSTTIVFNQLVALVAEDNAIEDTIYHLHRALNAGRIDLDRFLRSTRLLGEEQFMKRTLIDKIRAGIPLDFWGSPSSFNFP